MWQRREISVSGKSGEYCVAGVAGELGGGGGGGGYDQLIDLPDPLGDQKDVYGGCGLGAGAHEETWRLKSLLLCFIS